MKKSLALMFAALLLGGCPQPAPPPTKDIKTKPTPQPPKWLPWLAVEPVCEGAITRAEWLVCDDKKLNALHRRLATEWEQARQYASREQLRVQQNQLVALLSERTACRDALCIATAYRRYIAAPPPPTGPVVKPKPKPKPRPHPRWRGGEAAGIQSCESEIGRADALELARQCNAVGGHCSVRQSCARMESKIERVCVTSRRPPSFCP